MYCGSCPAEYFPKQGDLGKATTVRELTQADLEPTMIPPMHLLVSMVPMLSIPRYSMKTHAYISRQSEAVMRPSVDALKAELLAAIPQEKFGAPATNMTTPADCVARIGRLVADLEDTASPLARIDFAEGDDALDRLSGAWQLIYSDASEITNLVRLPLGFRLGPVFQPIDAGAGRFENQARVEHILSIAAGTTRVVARFWLAERGEVNRVGVENGGNRINVKFERVIFSLRR